MFRACSERTVSERSLGKHDVRQFLGGRVRGAGGEGGAEAGGRDGAGGPPGPGVLGEGGWGGTR